MSTPTDTRPTPPAVAAGTDESPPRPTPSGRAAGTYAGRLVAWCDPEWLWFLGFALLPAVLGGLIGDRQKASFFFGAAVYAAALKWLGWVVLGRRMAGPRLGVLFPVELFAGLATACVWFYARNAVGALWPASYGLGELGVLPPLLAALHLFGAARKAVALARSGQRWRPTAREVLSRAALYAPFWGGLAVILWRVSGSLNPQTIDPIFHAFAARTYVETGLTQPHPFVGATLPYPSAFGAVNAVAMSLAPLPAAQALNLQHVFWYVAAVFLLAVTPALLVGRWFRALGLVPLVFLVFLPLYALYPDSRYSATPRQLTMALLPAVGVLPVLAPARGGYSFAAAGAVVAVLGILAGAMNPACVPFAAFTVLVALTTFVVRARRALGQHLAKAFALHAGLVGVAALLVLGCDQYYGPRLRHALGRSAAPPPVASDAGPEGGGLAPLAPPSPQPEVGFSLAAGLRALAPVKVLGLAENATLTRGGRNEEVLGWTGHWPYQGLPGFGLAAAAVLAGLVVARRRRGQALPAGVALLTLFALGCGLTWLACKAATLFMIGGLISAGAEPEILRVYLGFMLLRWDLVLLFAVLCAAGLSLHLLAEKARPGRRLLLPLAGVLAGLLLATGIGSGRWPRAGEPVLSPEPMYVVTADDLTLVDWCDKHLPRERGLIGMAAGVGRTGVNREEEHVTGVGGVSAFLLRGKQGNYCFTVRSLEGARWYDGYSRHVRDNFDPGWCLENGVRYFYVSPVGRRINPGIDRAIETGRLRELHAAGESGVYEVVGEGVRSGTGVR